MNTCAENKPFYVRSWRRILSDWLNWPEDRISRWLSAFDDELEDRDSGFFYHETAMHYMMPLLLRDSFCEQLRRKHQPNSGPPTYWLRHELENAIGKSDVSWNDDFDWEAARQRVEQVLARHGQTIPRPDELTNYETRMLKARAA